MASKFGGISVEAGGGSRFGGVAVPQGRLTDEQQRRTQSSLSTPWRYGSGVYARR